jgi:phenylpropionate dioxygenase-like ring-hydroxylating dioxygenase large terminal subunit
MSMTAPARRDTSDTRIDDLIARQRCGYALDQAFYRDPEIFEHDVERLLMRHWLCAGHDSLIPDPGDYFLFELATESAIVVRGQDGIVRALANVCRHRGSRVCAAPSGQAKIFVCPYHAWSYGLDGSLLAARHMPEGFDKTSHGLKPIQVRVIQGLIFVCFAAAPLGLAHLEATVNDCFGPYDWAQARIAHRETYKIAANWKLAVENYLECYHCGPSHPEYSKLHALEQPMARIEKLNARMEKRAAALGLSIPLHEHWQGSQSGEEAAFGFRYALYDQVVTGSEDGKPVAPLMGRFSDYDGGVTSVHLGPTSFLISYPDHGVIYRFIPRAPEICEMEVIWLVCGHANEGADYDRSKLTWLWQVTSEADKRIVEENQLGVNSRFYEPGPYAPMEYNTRRYIDWYLGEIA